MKRDKKLVFVILIFMFMGLFSGYLFFGSEYYFLSVKTNKSLYDYADGVLVKDFFKGTFYLNVNFANPDDHCMVGLFIYDPEKNDFRLLEASGGSDNGECKAIKTTEGYSITNKVFYRFEKIFRNGNIINQMLENKDNTYLCIAEYDIYSMTIDDCYKVEFKKK